MKNIAVLNLSIFILAFTCEDEVPLSHQCVAGKIVGQKCDIYALQLNQKLLGAREWTKKNLATGEIEGTYANVIGLLNLPGKYRENDQIIFVTLREPTKEEKNISCYADMPSPPSPFYVIISASETECDETEK